MKIFKLSFLSILIAALSACAVNPATQDYGGQKISRNEIKFIKKGVTSRAEVEARLGQPTTVSITPNDGRIAIYQHVRIVAPHFFSFGSEKVKSERSSLQIVYQGSIVKDYEYQTSASTTSIDPWSGKEKEIKE